jgi:signal transduction histidine kinase
MIQYSFPCSQHNRGNPEDHQELASFDIYRILQESLNNVAKHSDADTVTVCLEEIDNRIELTVSDNGEGFDLNEVLEAGNRDRGLGLQSIRERTELFDGLVADIQNIRDFFSSIPFSASAIISSLASEPRNTRNPLRTIV